MATSVAYIATLLLSGVALGVTIGAVAYGPMPIWLGLSVGAAITIVAICGTFDKSTTDDPRD